MTSLYDFTVKDIKNEDWKLADTTKDKVNIWSISETWKGGLFM